jgi:DNA polymerase III alpha subunit
VEPALQERLDHELGVIHALGLDELYLTFHDLYRFARARGHAAIVAGPAAGSLAVHRLVPSPVNPVRHRLLFERHLDPGQTFAPVLQLNVSGGPDELLAAFRTYHGFDPNLCNSSDRAFSREWHPPGGGKSDRTVITVVTHPGLGILAKVASLVRERHGADAIPDVIPDSDPGTMAVFRRGETDDVIGFQDRHLRDRLPGWNPEGIRDLAALLAVTSSAAAAVKVECPGEENLSWKNPVVKEVLDETRGELLYHEQVIELVHRVGGWRNRDRSVPADDAGPSASVAPSAGNFLQSKGIQPADGSPAAMELLKAMWKRDHARIDEFRRRFVVGGGSSDIDASEAGRVFDFIARRGPGTVCKANALTAAHIGYQLAWLKSHFPAEFEAACRS